MDLSVSNLPQKWTEDGIKEGLKRTSIDLLISCGYESSDAVSTLTEKDIQNLDLPMAQKTILRRWVIKILQSKVSSSSEDSSNDIEEPIDELTEHSHKGTFPPVIQSLVNEDILPINMENTGEIAPNSSTKGGNSITMKKRTDVRNTSNCVIADKLHVVKNEFVLQGKNKGETTLSKNIKGTTKLTLKQQQENISMTTYAFTAAEQILEDLNFVMISGRPGDGKTCIGRKLLALKAEHGFDPYCINSVKILQKILNVEKRQIFFMDDVFGTVTSDKNKVNKWFHHFENLRCSVDGNKGKTLLVFASRNYILKDVLYLLDKGSFFKAFSIVDLSNDHCLTIDEKEKMAKIYNEKFNLNLSEDEINTICLLDTSYGFPYALNLFSKSSKIRQLGLKFFENPREKLLSEISGFAHKDKIKYCTFVMTSIMEKVSISKLDDSCEKSNEQKLILRVSGLCDNTPFTDIIKTFKKLKDIYFQTHEGDTFIFSHETYKEATMANIAETHLKLVLEKFDFDFILSSTATTNSGEEDAYSIHVIPRIYFKVLAQRFIDEYKNEIYNLYNIMKHRCWDDLCFVLEFEQFMSDHSLFHNMINFMQSRGTLDKTTFFWSIWHKKEKLVLYILDKCKSKNMTDDLLSLQKDTSDGLIAASYRGLSRECLELLIKFGGDVNAESTFQTFGEDDDGYYEDQFSCFEFIFDDKFGHEVLVRKMTPLMASIYGKQPNILQFLLKKGAQTRILQDNGMSMVHLAAIENDIHVLKVLLDYPLNGFPGGDNKGYTPFHYAKSLDIIKILYEHHPHILQLRCRGGNTPLHLWARRVFFHSTLNKEICKWVCLKAPKLSNCRNQNGLTVIHSLVKSNQEDNAVAEMIEILITFGANVNASTNRGRTPLHSAARSSNVRSQTAQILLKYGIQINARDIEGRTALYYALFTDNKVLDVLLKAKADPNIIDEYGLPILHSLITDAGDGLLRKETSIQFSHEYRFDFKLIEQLIKIGLDINLKSTKNDNTILHHLLSSMSMLPTYSKIEILLKLGGDPNQKNNKGSSSTMFAACVGIPLLQLLIQFEGDISLSNCKGETIAHKVLLKCTENHALSVITYLHEKRVSVHNPDNSGKTPLDIAFERRFENVIKFLLKNCPSKTLFSLALSKGLRLEEFDKENRNVCNFLRRRVGFKLDTRPSVMRSDLNPRIPSRVGGYPRDGGYSPYVYSGSEHYVSRHTPFAQ
ncbi:uncharacterized protein LOC134247903 [Saccostrea cucullata]|uniref:uncharacterized protein LOC134247903 n=1 Tax=Saccostrea cuccullata TaxID=36930 RepID=UPI002ED359E0